MSRSKIKFHYIYKTTCSITNRYYYGMHSTYNIDDEYLGSGKRLRYSIRKYGKENHKKEIIEFCKDKLELKEKEFKIINEELLNDPLCMNLQPGGGGGWSSEMQSQNGIRGNVRMKWLRENDEDWKNKLSIKHSNYMINSYKNGTRIPNPPNWTGRKHKEETKQKIGFSNSIKQLGQKNSQYGTHWITNGVQNKKINKNCDIPDEWYLGRIVKNC